MPDYSSRLNSYFLKSPPWRTIQSFFFFFFFYVCLTFVVLTSLLTHSVAVWLWPRYPPQTFTKLSTAGSCDNNLSTGGCWVAVVVVVVRLFKCHTKQQVSGVAAGTARVSSGRTAWCSPSQPEGCEEWAAWASQQKPSPWTGFIVEELQLHTFTSLL